MTAAPATVGRCGERSESRRAAMVAAGIEPASEPSSSNHGDAYGIGWWA